MTRGLPSNTAFLTHTMSDRNSESGSEDKYEKLNGKGDDICRDFLRNVCRRGKHCRYRHPEAGEAKELGKQHEYTFCHDYQNTRCRRLNCKFLHCTREEEEYYKQTAQLPVRLQQAAALGIGVAPHELPLLKGEIPICKDFLKGECKRGAKCKFRHLSVAEYEYELRKSTTDHRPNHQTQNSYDPAEDDFDRFDNRFDYGHSALKRRRADLDGFTSSFEARYTTIRPLSYQLLDEENNMLRRKVEEMKKQVADLTAANEVLLEQNARYRVSKSNHVQTINVPVSQALSVSQSLAAAGVATGGVAPTPSQQQLNHINNSLAQQIAMNNDLVSQHALQQRIAREQLGPPPQAQCSLSAQSLSPSVTINPPTIVPVSLPQSNISAVSLTPASLQQNLPPPVSLAQRTPHQSLPLSAQNSPLVSYPIVSQSMRTQSSLAH
ncbi:zinc finger CCCH domain-containing protein 10-like [Octopus vulgaris]|uniref:Zinc finger CCCH domain-containing protein 10-like n=3 Tax=Octopus TaxID=6643 RepID=A0AA36B450_OCTVU|nr:zinc finger CCCH domain-containing protein 10-like [Octopus sinensis]CAI9726612.1 zinc finger CCCH domain-containing protein 10-like [Octopus vulgaris]